MPHLSTLTLNQLRYGELDEHEEHAARAHLHDCQRCASRLQAQEANRAAFVTQPVPPALRQPAPRPARAWWRWLAPAGLALAALLLTPLALDQDQSTPGVPVNGQLDHSEYIQTKGAGITLEAWRDGRDGPTLLPEHSPLAPGDVVQLKFAAEGLPWVSFGGIDGSGATEIYGSYATDGQGIERAPFALTLDTTPGEQRFYALFTWDKPSEAEIQRAISTETAPKDSVLRSLRFPKR